MREQTGKKEIPLQAHKSDFSENFHSINKITENSSILSSNETEKINGCIIILLSNKNLNALVRLIQRFESLFNKKYKYPYILFNNEEFTSEFKIEIVKHTHSNIDFGLIAKEHWDVPDWIDQQKLKRSIRRIGFSLNYRQMCRFNSGFFFRHELTLKYDYFMRLDSDSEFQCEFDQDPFRKFIKNGISYGFVLASDETRSTIPNLWKTIKQWAATSLNKMNTNSLNFISHNHGKSLDRQNCIFYNNFEMADFSVFRSENYLSFFEYLDQSGGFFYERWVNLI